MSFRKSLFLACLLAILCALVFKIVMPKEQARELATYALGGIGGRAIERIEFVNSSGEFSIENTKVEPTDRIPSDSDLSSLEQDRTAQWKLRGVEYGALERSQLNSLIETLAKLKLENQIPGEEIDGDKALYGLANPLAELRIVAGEHSTTLKFGKKNEYLGTRYVEIGSTGAMYLVPDSLYELASKKALDYRNRNPFDIREADIKRIEISHAAEQLALENDQNGMWKIVEPANFSASSEKVSTLLRELRSIRVTDFVEGGAETPAKYGLDSPEAELRIVFKDETKQPFVLKFGAMSAKANDQPRHVQRDGEKTVYTVEARDPLGLVIKSVNELRERHMFRFPVDAVTKVIYDERGASTLTVEKKGESWSVNGSEGDAPFIREALQRLSDLDADDFPKEGRDFGFSNPTVRITVTLTQKQGEVSERTLLIGSVSDTTHGKRRYFAGVDDMKEPFILEEPGLRQILPRYEALVKTSDQGSPVVEANP